MNNSSPLLVGITGGIGAGKTTVAQVFSILSIPVYNADDRAKWLIANDDEVRKGIIEAFGERSFTEGHTLNRSFLAETVFADERKTKIINGLVHPAVRKDFIAWVAEQNSPYVMKEAALLFESGSYKDLDKVINVTSPLKIRISRILMRDPHRSLEQVNDIIDKQLPDEHKNKLADYIVKNNDTGMIIPQVLNIHEKLLKEVDKR